jgi:hypothetical protein
VNGETLIKPVGESLRSYLRSNLRPSELQLNYISAFIHDCKKSSLENDSTAPLSWLLMSFTGSNKERISSSHERGNVGVGLSASE